MAMDRHQTGQEDFSVSLAASACVNLHNHVTGETAPHIIHLVAVTQPVQSWTVLRDHVDFLAMDDALGGAISGLPSFGSCRLSSSLPQGGQAEVDAIVQARNAAQEWLSSVLAVPAVRDSPVMKQFLCYGANVVPSQFVGLVWVNFTTVGETTISNIQATIGCTTSSNTSTTDAGATTPRHNLDEMEMEDMFALDDDTNDNEGGDGNSLGSEDDAEYLQGRYAPTEEPLTQSEIMEIQQDYKQVEMVEDVGSLAQSLGASHLGRSLNLQKEMMSFKQQQMKIGDQVHQMQHQQTQLSGGINIMSNPEHVFTDCDRSVSTQGGIGGAVAKAENCSSYQGTQAHVKGLGDSFHRTAPVSAPRLDSFKMIKVIGKGSFGESSTCCL